MPCSCFATTASLCPLPSWLASRLDCRLAWQAGWQGGKAGRWTQQQVAEKLRPHHKRMIDVRRVFSTAVSGEPGRGNGEKSWKVFVAHLKAVWFGVRGCWDVCYRFFVLLFLLASHARSCGIIQTACRVQGRSARRSRRQERTM